MADIRTLLNPMSERRILLPQAPTPTLAAMRSPASPRKKAKLTKDAPVFHHGPIRGECRFPPDEYQDQELAAYHQQFELNPFGEIADYPRHIPYNSEKKDFLERTNREYLEVFQYTFKVPNDETQYTVLWDYNIGLVRMTPLFKCTGHAKTTPAKALNKNPGLKDICHSITGGALVAQGYWFPMAAAKAMAATFCYEIRHTLTPVFGHDFPQMCIKPGDEGFDSMLIDPAITRQCAQEARRFREREPHTTPHISAAGFNPRTPSPRAQRGKVPKGKIEAGLQSPYNSPYDSPCTTPYDTDISSDDNFIFASPTPLIFRNPWTTVNTPKTPPRSVPHPERRLPSPRAIISSYIPRPMLLPDLPLTPSSTVASRDPSVELSPTTLPRPQMSAIRSTCDDDTTLDIISDSSEGLDGAIDVLSLATSLTRYEILRRLGMPGGKEAHNHLDAAITMESLKTGMPWKEVADRLDLSGDGHKRSASW